MAGSAKHYVSPSALTDFRKCRRCFWLDRNAKLKWPRGAFPTLPGGVDLMVKSYFDEHRAAGTLPKELVGRVGSAGTKLYPDMLRLKQMRNARSPLLTMVIGNVKLVGGIDDLLVHPDGSVSPFDAKTRGYAFKPEQDPFEYYRMQMNDYGLLLQADGLTLSGSAFLGYWVPQEFIGSDVTNGSLLNMTCMVYAMTVDLEAAREEVLAAGVCLDGDLPEPSATCERCPFLAAHAAALAVKST